MTKKMTKHLPTFCSAKNAISLKLVSHPSKVVLRDILNTYAYTEVNYYSASN